MRAMPSPENISVAYRVGGDNQDIRNLLESLIPKASKQMAKASESFKGRNEKETCKNIFDYITQNFTYVVDGSEQVIKLPSALLQKKVGDCKSFSLFTSAILQNLKIPYSLIYASYTNDPTPGHVYVQTDSGCIIDAVYGVFNAEKKSNFKYRKKMNISYIGSIAGCSCGGSCNGSCRSCRNSYGVGKCNYHSSRSKGVGAAKPVRKIALAPGRGLFLAIVKANLDGFASKLQKVNADKLKKTWENIGGSYPKLVAAIKSGSSRPAKRLGLLGLIRKKLKAKGGVNGIGAASDADVQAAIVAASVAIGTALPGVGNVAAGTVGAVLAALYPVVKDLVAQTPAAEETDNLVQTSGIVSEPDEVADQPETQAAVQPGVKFDFQKSLPLIIAAGVGIYYITKK
jgi:hypothetical protein